MQLTDRTMSVLKNYATINPNIVIEKGNVVKTISEAKNVLSSAQLDVEFPETFGIYDLNEFLNVLSLTDDPNLKFESEYVVVSDGVGRSRTKYFYSALDVLTKPSKDIIMPEPDVTFTLDRNTLAKIRRAASVLGHTELSVSRIDNVVSLSVLDSKDNTSNVFTIDVDGNFTEDEFNFIFNISNLKMVDGDYKVSLSSKLISHFVNTETATEYWVALEKTSTFGV